MSFKQCISDDFVLKEKDILDACEHDSAFCRKTPEYTLCCIVSFCNGGDCLHFFKLTSNIEMSHMIITCESDMMHYSTFAPSGYDIEKCEKRLNDRVNVDDIDGFEKIYSEDNVDRFPTLWFSRLSEDFPVRFSCKVFFDTESRSFSPWLRSPTLSDVTFDVCGTVIPAHKIILAQESTVFEKMFTNGMKESEPGVKVVIEGCTAEAFLIFLQFIYTKDIAIDITEKNMHEMAHVYSLADRYRVLSLCESLTRRFSKAFFNDSNVHDILSPNSAPQSESSPLYNVAERYTFERFIRRRDFEQDELYHDIFNAMRPSLPELALVLAKKSLVETPETKDNEETEETDTKNE